MAKLLKILTKSAEETRKIGEKLAKELMKSSYAKASADKLKTATVLSLEGELGAGKTTFTQGFVKGLGIKENPRSPTFVLMQIYTITPSNSPFVRGRKKTKPPSPLRRGKGRDRSYGRFSNFIHIDAYRIASKDLKSLGWREFVKNKENIILIEWGNRVKNILPKNSLRIIFEHVGHHRQRLIKVCK